MRMVQRFREVSCYTGVALLALSVNPTRAQQPLKAPTDNARAIVQLHQMSGRLVSQGTNDQPTGELRVKTYVLEELQFAQPLQVQIGGRAVEVNRSWRLSVTGGPFTVRDMPAMIWIDDKVAGIGLESADLTRISVIIFDGSMLHEGAAIALTYGQHDPQRTELMEKLTLKSAK